ncbi:MAG: choice-of-anchor B family protein [Fimbriimonadaceae bacterium]|nr:choice-of-anchor B family protein [Fimbriimonadaceae bacterium]QYK56014.1 MAG: choice-of-anchor B family protein [Fimbriimonadaceae bacterium]
MNYRQLALAMAAALALPASAQFQSDKVTLYKNFTLAQLQAGAGNDCWGYVSPSGREYALMGTDVRTVFIEVTDPNNPVILTSIPHSSSSWSDIKVYRDHCYVVTEANNTGVQVISLANIDSGTVTLVRTITNPGRTHNIHIDEASGYLYTCGSNQANGTTMCFNLSNPANPVVVGSSSLTPTYQHDVQVRKFTSGPYAGREIMFGCGENRGLEIWDVTNKSNVQLIRRVAYPFVGYCHQCWLSPDGNYLYLDDEFDESDNGFTTRSLIFDVSVLETADLVGTFTSGTRAIDHNQYNKNGYIFQANYTSGLRIFDGYSDPQRPVQVGWFDTYPANDNASYNGAWSTYPYLPSGNVLISDINRGFFLVNVTEATKRTALVESFQVGPGTLLNGGLTELQQTDGQYLTVAKGITPNSSTPPIRVEFNGTSMWTDVTKLRLELRTKVSIANLTQKVEMFDYQANDWVTLQSGPAPLSDTDLTVTAANPDRFIEPTSKTVRARVSISQAGPVQSNNWRMDVDKLDWIVNP